MLILRRFRCCVLPSCCSGILKRAPYGRRSLLTLAIETSCDDTSVAILERHDEGRWKLNDTVVQPIAALHFHEKITSDNSTYGGVHPLVSLNSHQENLAKLISQALHSLPDSPEVMAETINTIPVRSANGMLKRKQKPDFITVTRGPGMRSSLSTGLDTAKGLSVAWQIPLIGVHHMQAHALTPRLMSALQHTSHPAIQPTFPFLSLLVSGGHTLLLHSTSLTSHRTLAQTADIAIGDFIDKTARATVPPSVLESAGNTMYGPLLEAFAFPTSTYSYIPPLWRADEVARRPTAWSWTLGPPLAETRGGEKSKAMEYSFSGLDSACRRIVGDRHTLEDFSVAERRDLAREALRVAFEHLASRVVMGLKDLAVEGRNWGVSAPADVGRETCSFETNPETMAPVTTLVVSGGVAANLFLRAVLRAFLDARGFQHLQLVFPPPALCTDNAAMIAWAGIEMFQAGWNSKLSCRAVRKWGLDEKGVDGGILGVGGWQRRGPWSEGF